MSEVALTTVSPSSSKITRSTPCVDGCCGPMLRTIVCAGPVAVWTVVVMIESPRPARSAESLHRIILAHGMSFPGIGHQQPPQFRVALESHSKQIEDLPLVPICG